MEVDVMAFFKWICPVCGNYNMGETPSHDVCIRCEWEDDHLQRDNPDYDGGANYVSLNQYRERWRESQGEKAAH